MEFFLPSINSLPTQGGGDFVNVYDILQSKEDKATLPIYYEARLAKIDLKPEERPKIDPNFQEVTEDAEESTKESLRGKWAQLEATVQGQATRLCGDWAEQPVI